MGDSTSVYSGKWAWDANPESLFLCVWNIFIFSQSFRKVKTILTSQTIQKQVVSRMRPAGYNLLVPIIACQLGWQDQICIFSQWVWNSNVHMNHLRILLKCRFCCEILCIQPAPRWYFGSKVWSVNHTSTTKAFKDPRLDPSMEESLDWRARVRMEGRAVTSVRSLLGGWLSRPWLLGGSESWERGRSWRWQQGFVG